jgi:carbonic anhydrase
VPPVVDQETALEHAAPDQPVDVPWLPSQLLTLEVLRRLLESTLTFRDDEVKAAIEADTGVRPPVCPGGFPDPAQDVRQSIRRITASPFVPHRDSVRGFVYGVATGKLREVT